MKRAFVEIDLKKLAENIAYYRSLTPTHTRLMAVVKADAYGHGAVEVSDVAMANGADYLGVAWVREAIQLREAGISAPVLILSEPTVNVASDIVRLDVTQTVYSYGFAKALSEAARKQNRCARVHIKVDTGMGRIGVSKTEVAELVSQVSKLDGIMIEGIFTHFAKADEKEDPYTLQQLEEFNEITDMLTAQGISIPIRHAANTSATENFPDTHLDMVRIGIGLYGGVLTFKSKIAYTKTVPAGFPVSYGCTYETKKATNLATISAGYADGLVRLLSNRGRVLIRGKAYPIVGRVCMDMTMVDLGDDMYPVGEEVVIIGTLGEETISVDDVAGQAETIGYEILCGIGKRVNRIYMY